MMLLHAEILSVRDRFMLSHGCKSLTNMLKKDDRRVFWTSDCPQDLLQWRNDKIARILYGTFSIDRRAKKGQVRKALRAVKGVMDKEVHIMWKVWAAGLTCDGSLAIITDTYDDCDKEQVHELGGLLERRGWSVRFLRGCYPSSEHCHALRLKEEGGLMFLHGDYFRRGVLSAAILRRPPPPPVSARRRRAARP